MREFAIFIILILVAFGLNAINAPAWLAIGFPVAVVFAFITYMIYRGSK